MTVKDAAEARRATDEANRFRYETAIGQALQTIHEAARRGRACVRMSFGTVHEFQIVVDGLRDRGFEVETHPHPCTGSWNPPLGEAATVIEVRW